MRAIIILIFFVPSVYSVAQEKLIQEEPVQFEYNLKLSEDTGNYFFSEISAVVSNSKGDIYIADGKQSKILVFDKSGSFKFSFGRAGRGPGEFTEVTSMTLLPDDEILIFDYFQFRFTKYDAEGNLIATKVIEKEIKPNYMRHVPGKGIVLFYRSLDALRGEVNHNEDYLIHIFDEDLNEIESELVPVSHTIDTSQPFELFFVGGVFTSSFTTTDSTLTLAPFFYRGKVLQYSLETNKLKRVFNGYTATSKTYVEYDNYKDVLGKGMIANSAVYGKLHGIMNNESMGIFKKSNGDYLHISLLSIEDKQHLYTQLFDEDTGELKARGPVTNLEAGLLDNGFYQRVLFYWMDQKDQLYVIVMGQNGDYLLRVAWK
ncbi:6-bladed beta-propeller [Gracilimonas sp.]|uniref:6-bladed beta-propeller n=1 Tax=Gracilimonas sp. TaxID=1974203 RepID=UPI0028713BD1|nr:6-bladed beta-propeller [Gracilimonas sp.]